MSNSAINIPMKMTLLFAHELNSSHLLNKHSATAIGKICSEGTIKGL